MSLPYHKQNARNTGRAPKHNYVLNNNIKSSEIRVTGSGEFDGQYTFGEAITIARSNDLDLIEISVNNGQSICRLMEIGKFLYEKKKKEKQSKKATSQTQLKIVKLGPDTFDNDIEYRVKQAIEWLKAGDKVKCELLFKGRQIVHTDKGRLVMLKFANGVSDYGELEAMPQLNGKVMTQIIKPKTKTAKKVV